MKFFALILALASASAYAQESYCMSSCEFYFCGGDSNVEVGARNDIALTSPICRTDGGKVGVVYTGEAKLMTTEGGKKVRIPISTYVKDLPKKFFNAYNLNDHLHRRELSGIGHQYVRPCQLKHFVDKCWIIPVSRDREFFSNERTDEYDVDCISFSSTAPRSQVQCEEAKARSPVKVTTDY